MTGRGWFAHLSIMGRRYPSRAAGVSGFGTIMEPPASDFSDPSPPATTAWDWRGNAVRRDIDSATFFHPTTTAPLITSDPAADREATLF